MKKLVLPLLLALGSGAAAAQDAPPAAAPTRGTELTVLGTPGTVLRVDDKPVGRLPLESPLVLPAGPHRFQLERQGRRFESDVLTIPEGRIAELSLTAGTEGTAVAVLSLTPLVLLAVRGRELDDASRQALRAAVQEAAQAEHSVLIPGETMTLVQRGQPADCMTQPACQLRFAAAAAARLVLRLELPAAAAASPQNGNGALLRGELVDVKTGQTAVRGEQPSGSDNTQPWDAAQQLTRSLLSAAAKIGRGLVVVNSQPDGAQVTIDGQLRGATPWEGPSFPGPREVRIEKPNFEPHRAQINVVAEQAVKLDVELTAIADEPPPALPPAAPAPMPQRPRWRLGLGGAALGAGAIFIGFGGGALAIHGRCIDSPPNPLASCDQLYSTGGVGAGLTAVGGALLISGAVLLALPPQRSSRPLPDSVPLNR